MTRDTFKAKGETKLTADPTIHISLGEMHASDGTITYLVHIVRDGASIEIGQTRVKGRAEYSVAKWRYVLLGEPEPDIMDFDVDPTTTCSECGKSYTIYSSKLKCDCVPF